MDIPIGARLCHCCKSVQKPSWWSWLKETLQANVVTAVVAAVVALAISSGPNWMAISWRDAPKLQGIISETGYSILNAGTDQIFVTRLRVRYFPRRTKDRERRDLVTPVYKTIEPGKIVAESGSRVGWVFEDYISVDDDPGIAAAQLGIPPDCLELVYGVASDEDLDEYKQYLANLNAVTGICSIRYYSRGVERDDEVQVELYFQRKNTAACLPRLHPSPPPPEH